MAGPRVGLLCGYLDPSRDGVADYTRRLAGQLRGTGFEPLVVTTYEWAAAAGDGSVGVTETWDARGVAAAALRLRRLGLDVVHVQFSPSVFGFSRAVGMLPLCLPRSIPLVVTLHEYGVWAGQGRCRRIRSAVWSAAERLGYADRETLLLTPRADCVLVPSPEHLETLRDRLGRRAPTASEVPIGLNVEVAPGDPARDRADVRRELGAARDAPLVVFFGFLHPAKGLDRLIAAVAHVREQRPGTHLLLIGGAESHSVPSAAARKLRRELEQVAHAHRVSEVVHVTGYLPDAEVSRLLRAADVAAFPFDAGITRKSSSLLAAVAAGLPVVATAAPGTLSGPTEDEGLLLIPPRDTTALADALRRVLGDRDVAARLTTAARSRVGSQRWDAIAASHAEIYARALASQRSGAPWTATPEPSRVGHSTAAEGDTDVRT